MNVIILQRLMIVVHRIHLHFTLFQDIITVLSTVRREIVFNRLKNIYTL